ncbi:chemotaxis protein CheA [Xanthobacteraceae bacterium A53D]
MTEDLMAQFLIEAGEQIAQAERSLTVLSRQRSNAAAFDASFRALHTLKGSTGLFDLAPMGDVLHAAEDLLAGLRDVGRGGAAHFETLLSAVDLVDQWLEALRRTGDLPAGAEPAGAALRGRLKALTAGAGPEIDQTILPTPAWRTTHTFDGLSGLAIRYEPRADAYFMGEDPVAVMAAVPGLSTLRISPREAWGTLDAYDPYACNLVLEAVSTAGRPDVEAALRLVADQVQVTELTTAAPVSHPAGEDGRRMLRVDAGRLDRLANLADDLVIAKNGLSELATQIEGLADGRRLGRDLRLRQAQLDRLIGDLHDTVGQVRLLPLAGVFARFPRLVREIARSLDKKVTLEIEGSEIEVDKAVADGLFEPLLHILRNAVDHGVEPEAARISAGKPGTATVRLTARLSGDQVEVAVADDGAGIDPNRVRATAVARGLIAHAAADALNDSAAIDLIFIPGFSSSGKVSAVSGRGVGMDVVRDSAVQLGGKVAVASAAGHGSTVSIILPVTRILTRIIVVTSGGERYGLALDAVVETVRVRAADITPVRNGRAFRLRDQAVPLVPLTALLGLSDAGLGASEVVVVARVQGEPVGFAVERIIDRMTVAVRPMTGLLAGAPGMRGTCLLADGGVLMVLDLPELMR